MKKTISIFLICAMLMAMIVAVIPASAAAPAVLPKSNWAKPWDNGEEDWVAIGSYADLVSKFQSGTPEAPTKYYLTSDIQITPDPKNTVCKWKTKCENFILDGNGKSFIYSAMSCAVFSEINNGTIRNLKLTGELDCDGALRNGSDNNTSHPTFSPFGNGWKYNGKVVMENIASNIKLIAKNQDSSFKPLAGVIAYSGEGSSFTDVVFTGEFEFENVASDDKLGAVAGIVGDVRGSATFNNCSAKNIKVVISDYKSFGNGESAAGIGLLAARVNNGNVNFVNCSASGNVIVTKAKVPSNIGGLVGAANGACSFVDCKSAVSISTNGIAAVAGGLVGAATAGLSFTRCTNDAPVSVVGNTINSNSATRGVGGFVGGICANAPITFKDCTNTENGVVTHSTAVDQAGTGGFIGRVSGEASGGYANQKITFTNCKNDGDIVNASTMAGSTVANNSGLSRGGFVGLLNTPAGFEATNCVNSGDIIAGEKDGAGTYEGAGGFIGEQRCLGFNWISNIKKYDAKFTNCVNLGNIQDASAAGGIIGKSVEIIYPADTTDYKYTATFENCANLGNLTAPVAGGMFADSSNASYNGTFIDIVANNCANGGDMYGVDSGNGVVGGILGDIRYGSVKVSNSINTGRLQGKDYTSGIVGNNSDSVPTEIKNCINSGKIESVFENVNPMGAGMYEYEGNIFLKGLFDDDFDEAEEADAATVEAAIIELGLFASYNFIELGDEIGRAEKLKSSDYDRDAWKPLADALSAAKSVYDGGMLTVSGSNVDILTQSEVNEVYYALLDARVALVADFTALDEAIAKAEALDSSNYTKASWSTVKKAVEDAKEVKTTVEAQAEVDEALKYLLNAMSALVKVDKPATPDKPENPETPNTPEAPEDPETPETPDETDPPAQTQKPTEAPKATEPAKEGGCGGVIGGAAVVLAAVIALGTGVSLKKKD